MERLRKLEREYAAKAAAGDANAGRELADIRGILKGKGVQEQKTLTRGEVSAVKRANAADLKEYPGKRGETAHRRLHKVLKKVTEEKRRVTSIADLAPKHSPASMDIIRANLGRGIRASATAAAEGKPMKRSERARRERVQAILARRTGVGSMTTAPRQKAAREAERAARALGEAALKADSATLRKKYDKHEGDVISRMDYPERGRRGDDTPKKKQRINRRYRAMGLIKREMEKRGEKVGYQHSISPEMVAQNKAREEQKRAALERSRKEIESNPNYQRNVAKMKARLAAKKAAAEKKK